MTKGLHTDRLEEILDLIQAEIEDTSPEDRRELLIKATSLGPSRLRDIALNVEHRPEIVVLEDDDGWLELVRVIKDMRALLNWMMAHRDPGGALLSFLEPSAIGWADVRGKFVRTTPSAEIKPDSVEIKAESWTIGRQESEIFKVRPESLSLLKALEDLPVANIKNCEGCNRVFVQPSRRLKRFCTTRCQNTHNVRRLRKKK